MSLYFKETKKNELRFSQQRDYLMFSNFWRRPKEQEKRRNITGQKDTTEDMTRGREDKTPLKTMSSTPRKGVTDLSFILSLEDNCSSAVGCWHA